MVRIDVVFLIVGVKILRKFDIFSDFLFVYVLSLDIVVVVDRIFVVNVV